ncbi:MAG: outer membrane beta-barrel family protein [Sediminibacterium sp.]
MNGRTIRFVIIQLLIVFYSFNTLAAEPGKVKGAVKDSETSRFVPFATVELLKSLDSTLVKATATNNDGLYLIENIAYGKYLLRISSIGYQTKILPEFEISSDKYAIQFETTNLLTETKSIAEVVVTGFKLNGTLVDDKTIYAVKSKSAEFAQSGLELLRQLPDVTVDYMSDNVRLAGSSNILFQVNGRKVERNYLMQLNPELVDKIEVNTNPGAKYESDVDAIINLILRKDMQLGLSGRVRVHVPTSSTILAKNNANLDLYLKKVRFYVAGNYNLYGYDTETTNMRTTFLPELSILSQNSTGITKGQKAGLSYGFDWFPNNNNTLNFYGTIRPRIPERNETVSDNTYTSNQIISHNTSNNKTIDKNYFYDYSLFYQHKFAKKFHEISFESYTSNKNNLKTSDYYEQNFGLDGILSDQLSNRLNQATENSNKQFILKVDYIYPFSEKLKLSTGYYGNFLHADYLYNNVMAGFADLISYDENRHAAYSNIAWTKGKFSFQTGLRYEFSDIHIIHGNNMTSQYDCLLPSASLQYSLGKKNSFRLNYRKSITRPGVNQLSPVNYKDDSFQQSIGNPDLTPAYANRIELTHRIQIKDQMYFSYKPYVAFIKNDIRLVNLPNSDSILIKKYNNVSNDFEYGMTLSGTLVLAKKWTISPSFTYYRRELKALPEYGIKDDMKRTSWRLNISSQYILPKEWALFIEYNYIAPLISYQTITHSDYDFVAGFNKAINKKISISVFTMNPWSRHYVYDKSTVSTYNMVQDTRDGIKYNYLLFVRLGYKFNAGKVGKKLERQVETEEEPKLKKGFIN